MSIEMFITSLIVTISVVSVAMFYLRHTTRQVIVELCKSESGADFWLKSADILAYSGALILVLIFGENEQGWVEGLRVTLILALSGIFITVMFVARNIWQTVSPQLRASK